MTITVVIPAQACGLIIGKGGERINALREQCQAKIQLQSKDRAIQGLDERTVTISGNLLNAQMVCCFPLPCSMPCLHALPLSPRAALPAQRKSLPPQASEERW